jgi:hypothetical protein
MHAIALPQKSPYFVPIVFLFVALLVAIPVPCLCFNFEEICFAHTTADSGMQIHGK